MLENLRDSWDDHFNVFASHIDTDKFHATKKYHYIIVEIISHNSHSILWYIVHTLKMFQPMNLCFVTFCYISMFSG